MVADVVRISVAVDFVVELFERGGELVVQNELWNVVAVPGARLSFAVGFPEDNVEDDVVVARVVFVPVLRPVAGMKMDFNVALAFGIVADFESGVAEIGAGFEIPPAGEDNFDVPAISGVELVKLEALIVPDTLDEPFVDGEGDVIAGGVAEEGRRENIGQRLTEELVANFAIKGCWHGSPAIYLPAMKMPYSILLSGLLALPVLAQDPAHDPVVLAVQKALPAVGNISTEQVLSQTARDPFEEMFRQFFGAPRQGAHSLGSGVVVDSDGWLVTNYHVVRRASRITVKLADGATYEARFVSGDANNDLALLKIEPKQPLTYIDLAIEHEPLLGETVIAIGNPFGFDHTVTKGIISAKNRKWPLDDPKFEDVLQTDAAINPGNSGGPLINTRGELVGINTAILSQAEGIGFAIPAQRVANLLGTWLSLEKRAHLWLGLRFTREAGQLVAHEVQADSPAAKAGFHVHDVIVTADGQSFTGVIPLQRFLLHHQAGDVVRFGVTRAGQPETLAVKLTALPKLSAIDLMVKKFGVTVQPLTKELAAAFSLTSPRGLLIAEVQKNTPAAEAGLQRGLVIVQIGGEEPDSLDRLAEQLADIKTGDQISMGILLAERRSGFTLQRVVTLTLPAR